MTSLGLYIHWPFCLSKCPYCDFNSHIREKTDHQRWKAALLQELENAAENTSDAHLVSIFFGGGTPSLMDADTVGALIGRAKELFSHEDTLEITLEANPTSIEAEKFKAFHHAGVNRLSVGIQALKDEALAFLGRQHSAKEALQALEIAATYFPRFSFDLIYARPYQTADAWKAELKEALSYTQGHVSLYQLTIEPQTPFAVRWARGETMALEEDPAAVLYELTEQMMNEAGLPPYEVSNYAAPGQECHHNLLYWNSKEYIGIGPGAHGRVFSEGHKYATSRYKVPETWLAAVEKHGHGLQTKEKLSSQEQLDEITLMGLRLRKGLSLKRLYEETGLTAQDAYPGLEILQKEGLLCLTPTHLVPSFEGRLCLNSVISFLLKKPEGRGSRVRILPT